MCSKAHTQAFPGGASSKKLACQCRRHKRCGFHPWVGKIPWSRKRQPAPGFLPGKSHGRRSLVGCSPWGHEELDMTEQLHFHFSLSCIGEGNGNPLQCSCLENPRDGGAWWAAVYGVAQSRTRLKRLSSSSSCMHLLAICMLVQTFVCFDYYTLQYRLKSGNVKPPALFFFLRNALAIWGLLWSHKNFRTVF